MLIFGLGRYEQGSGISAARFFVRLGARVTVTDLKTEKELRPTVRLLKKLPITFHLGGHRLADIRSADFVIRNPGVPSHSPFIREARRRGIPVMTDVSVFLQLCPCIVVGITGTRGKSTTTALVGEMLRAARKHVFVGGNIQRSPLTFLHELDPQSIVVLELSSWLLESLADINASPHAALVTNIYPDHLNIHRTMAAYVRAKENIFRFAPPGGVLVLNYDNAYTRRMGRGRSGVIWFSMKPLPAKTTGLCLRRGIMVVQHGSAGHGWHAHEVMPVNRMRLAGTHNIENALGASALALAVGAKQEDVVRVLTRFHGLPSRQEVVRTLRGVTWVNDTTATTPEAAIAALRRFGNSHAQTILIAGGADKKLKFSVLAREIKRRCKAVILLDGTATPKLKRELSAFSAQLSVARSMQEAVRTAKKITARGDVVLLSPGCASFGIFQNEYDRGDQFVRAVRRLR